MKRLHAATFLKSTGPDYPDRFDGFEHARGFCQRFFPWYNDQHRHSGIAYFTPSDVHYGRVPALLAKRQAVMDEAFARMPERFLAGVDGRLEARFSERMDRARVRANLATTAAIG